MMTNRRTPMMGVANEDLLKKPLSKVKLQSIDDLFCKEMI